MESLLGCYLGAKFKTHETTNEERYTDLHSYVIRIENDSSASGKGGGRILSTIFPSSFLSQVGAWLSFAVMTQTLSGTVTK